jgi:HSP20 family molecular chaperone IbpA
LYADIAGVAQDKLNLRVEQDALIIEGEIDNIKPAGADGRHTEVEANYYRRAFTLSKELDAEKISAQFKNGVLKLHIPKAEHAQPKRIDITIN